MKIAMSGLTLTCLFSSSQVIGVAAEKRRKAVSFMTVGRNVTEQQNSTKDAEDVTQHNQK